MAYALYIFRYSMSSQVMLYVAALLALIILSFFVAPKASAADYAFPVIGQSSYSNDFNAPRSNGPHHAIDIIANKHQKIVSRTDGVITFVGYPQPAWGYSVRVRADNGNNYWYIHMNNDTPGTDDGKGGAYHAYGPDIQSGNRVVKGQLLGYVGDSGNAESTVSHLHFEVTNKNNQIVNPYNGLTSNSYRTSTPVRTYPSVNNEIIPASRSFMGGYNIAFGDVSGDSQEEMIVASSTGGKRVYVFTKNGNTLLNRFEPNLPNFLGGNDVATGDIDGDGKDEIITGSGPGGKQVRVFESDGTLITKLSPYADSNFSGGFDVAAGDVDGDGTDEIITGTGRGAKQVGIFQGNGSTIQKIDMPYVSNIGVTIATGNFDEDPEVEIVTGARKGGGPRVIVYDGDNTQLSSYHAYTSSFKGGVKVEAGNIDTATNQDEILSTSQSEGSPRIKVTTHTGSQTSWSSYFAEEWWVGGYDLAVSDDGSLFSTMGANRRSTIRPVDY